MSTPNLEQADSVWQGLLAAANLEPNPPWRLGMIGVNRDENGWWFRAEGGGPAVSVPVDPGPFGSLLADLGACARVGEHEVEVAIVHTLGSAILAGQQPDWQQARAHILQALGIGVAALALGGIRIGEVAPDGGAAIVPVGPDVLLGHLDHALAEPLEEFARAHGLSGFRLTNDSWWTEDLLDGEEDPASLAERMTEIVEAQSWPWLIACVAAPASGGACEMAALATAQALLGAFALLAHPPGRGWGRGVPWIAGGLGPTIEPRWPGDLAVDYAFPTEPQHVDAMTRRLDNAENALGRGPAAALDVAPLLIGPTAPMLEAIAAASLNPAGERAPLATAAGLAWYAAATETPDIRAQISARALELLLAASDLDDIPALLERGFQWRSAHAEGWTALQPYEDAPDLDVWHSDLATVAEELSNPQPTAPWSYALAERSGRALDALQAALFAHA